MDPQINKLTELETKKFEVYDIIFKTFITETDDDDINIKNFIQYCVDNKIFLFFLKQFFNKQFHIIHNNIDFTNFFKYVNNDNKTSGNIMLEDIYKKIEPNYCFEFNKKTSDIDKKGCIIKFINPSILYDNIQWNDYITYYNFYAPENMKFTKSDEDLKSLMQSFYVNSDIIYFIQRFHNLKNKIKFENEIVLNTVSNSKDILTMLLKNANKEILKTVLNNLNISINDNNNNNNNNNDNNNNELSINNNNLKYNNIVDHSNYEVKNNDLINEDNINNNNQTSNLSEIHINNSENNNLIPSTNKLNKRPRIEFV